MNPDPHQWTQSRAAGKLYELEQRLNAMHTSSSPAVTAAPQKKKRTAAQRRNDRMMKKAHVHLKNLKGRTNKYGKKGNINKSQKSAAMKEAIKRAKKELNY